MSVKEKALAVAKDFSNQQLVSHRESYSAIVSQFTHENATVIVRALWGKLPEEVSVKNRTIPVRKIITPPVLEFALYKTQGQQEKLFDFIRDELEAFYDLLVQLTDVSFLRTSNLGHEIEKKVK